MKLEGRAQDATHALSTGDKLLHGQYTIQHYLSSGGFRLPHLARHRLDRSDEIQDSRPVHSCVS